MSGDRSRCSRCGAFGHAAQDHAWDPELRAQDRAGLTTGDQDAVLACVLAEDLEQAYLPQPGDPTMNLTTGQPCKGKAAARALARLVLCLRLGGDGASINQALAEADEALEPFDLERLLSG